MIIRKNKVNYLYFTQVRFIKILNDVLKLERRITLWSQIVICYLEDSSKNLTPWVQEVFILALALTMITSLDKSLGHLWQVMLREKMYTFSAKAVPSLSS